MKDKHIISNVIYMLKFLWKLNKYYCIAAIPNIILSACAPFVLIMFPKLIIDGIISGRNWDYILKLVVAMSASSLCIKSLQYIMQAVTTKQNNNMSFNLNLHLGTKAMQLQYQDLENKDVLDLFNRITRTLNMTALFDSIVKVVSNFITLIGLVFIISKLSVAVFIIVSIVICINVICDAKTKKYDYQWQKDASPYQRKFNYFTSLMYDFSYGKEIRINSLDNFFREKYNTESGIYINKLNAVIIKFLKLNSLRAITRSFQDLFIYMYLAYQIFMDQTTIGSFTMYISAVNSFSTSLMGITSAVIDLNQHMRIVSDFRSFMALEPMHSKKTHKLSDVLNNPLYESSFEFHFDKVSLKYPQSEVYALDNVSVKIRQGEKLAVVGLNGAGKTSFIKLLLRLYEPSEGIIYLNGVNILDIDYNDYVQFFSAVFQDFKLFAFPVYENIVMNNSYDADKLYDATKKSGLFNKLESLPMKFETQVYKIFDQKGVEFSGGDSQKLAIARAVYKDSQFIILDEPTSALDPLIEYEIYNRFNNMVNNKTVIYISHRLSSTRLCDNIAVFQEGNCVQYGSHEELVSQEGLYKKMFDMQADYYISR